MFQSISTSRACRRTVVPAAPDETRYVFAFAEAIAVMLMIRRTVAAGVRM